jgi:uncharacterized phage protein (TIGR02218 family)
MKSISTELKAGIISGKIASLVKLSLKDGSVLGYTDHDTPLTVDAVTYEPAAGLSKLKMYVTNSAEVSSQEIASSWLDAPEEDLLAGKYDNATIEVQWAYWEDVSLGSFPVFIGRLGSIEWTEDGFKASIENYLKDLARNLGTVVTGPCRHALFDNFSTGKVGACTLSPASFTFTGAVTYVLTDKLKFKIDNSQADGYFTNGLITWTSGANNGLSYEIKIHEVNADANIGNSFELFLPAIASIQVGDTYSVTAGCDKTFSTCKNKFSNGINFGGFPHIETGANI